MFCGYVLRSESLIQTNGLQEQPDAATLHVDGEYLVLSIGHCDAGCVAQRIDEIEEEFPDFEEYSLRIDPEFGIFWLYVKSLPPEQDWQKDKARVAMLLGMFFLANY